LLILVAEHDPARRRSQVDAELERRRVDLARHSAVVAHVVGKVLHAAHEAQAAGVHCLAQHGRIEPRNVARCERVAHQLHPELGLTARRLGQARGFDQRHRGASLLEIHLGKSEEERIALPARIREALVLGRGRCFGFTVGIQTAQ
jgi:hypothetical protein